MAIIINLRNAKSWNSQILWLPCLNFALCDPYDGTISIKKTAARHWPTKRLPEYVSTNFDICSSDSYHRIHQSSLLWSLDYNGCLTRAGPAGRGCRGPGSVWRNVDLCVENRLRSYSSFCTSPQLIVTRTDIWYWATAVFSITPRAIMQHVNTPLRRWPEDWSGPTANLIEHFYMT